MAIVYQKNKKTGTIYAYESTAYWDKEKKQSRNHRILIGKVDENGQIIPTGSQSRMGMCSACSAGNFKVKSFGATYLLNQISLRLGVFEDLKKCFPRDFTKILSVVFYLVMEGSNSVFRFNAWARRHHLPYSKEIDIDKLFSMVARGSRVKFFHLQSLRRTKSVITVYDASFLSSQTERKFQVFSNAVDKHNQIEELSIAFAFSGYPDRLPFYYHEQPEAISDMNTLNYIYGALRAKGYKNVRFVLGSEFCSIENINSLLKSKTEFILSVPKHGDLGTEIIKLMGKDVRLSPIYDDILDLSFFTMEAFWDYEKDDPLRSGIPIGDKRLFIHLLYSRSIGIEDAQFFNYRMSKYQQEIEEDELNPSHHAVYERYFEITKTPIHGVTAKPRKKAIEDAKRMYGFTILVSNVESNPVKAYNYYKNRHVIENTFSNIKERLNCNYPVVSSSTNLEGKIFFEFLALIFKTYINNTLQSKSNYNFNQFSGQQLLDELDMVECLSQSGKDLRWDSISDEIKRTLKHFGVDSGLMS